MAGRNFLLGAAAVLCLQLTTAKDIECGSTPKPDFKAPGRRISEEKCLEYNWERNNIEKCSKDPAHTDYPYVGMIGYTKENTTDLSFKCGAFLISPKFAMTAGNCVVQTRQLTPELVRFGNRNIDTGVPRVDVKIKRIISNPEYKPPKRDNDIALLELEEELPMTKSVQPICLWHSSLDGVKDVLNPGWGQGNSHGVFRETLRVMKVALIDHEKCEALVKNHFNRRWTKLQEYQICVDESKSDDPLCLGSSGTPLVTAGKQAGTEDQIPYAVGVNSFGFACNQGLGFYTKVSSFMDWIEPVVWPSS